MAVKEFLKALDKKKKKEISESDPVSSETETQSAESFAPAPPVESVMDTVGQTTEVQSPSPASAAQQPNPMAQPVALDQPAVAQKPSVLVGGREGEGYTNPLGQTEYADPLSFSDKSGALQQNNLPTVQMPQTPLQTEERARIEARLAQTNADIVASGGTVPSLGAEIQSPSIGENALGNLADSRLGKYLGGITTYDLNSSGNVTPGSGTLAFPALAEKAGTPAFGESSIPKPPTAPVVEIATPGSLENPSGNGIDLATQGAITEAGMAPGGMITRGSTGESFIGGSQVAANPEEISAFNRQSLAANTDAAARERMRYNAPTIEKFQTEEKKNIAEGRAPNVSAGQQSEWEANAPVRAEKEADRIEQKRIDERKKTRAREKADEYRQIDQTPGKLGSRAKAKKEVDKRFREQERYDTQQDRLRSKSEFDRKMLEQRAAQTISYQNSQIAARQAEAVATAAYRARPEKASANDKAISWIRANIPAEQQNDAILNVIGVDPLDLPEVGKTLEPAAVPTQAATIIGKDNPQPVGTTREQFGKNYKFDGKKWNEVK